ncbi:MAG: hypothetical protein R6T98_11910, partial [Desulfatiglandales bacterium]
VDLTPLADQLDPEVVEEVAIHHKLSGWPLRTLWLCAVPIHLYLEHAFSLYGLWLQHLLRVEG